MVSEIATQINVWGRFHFPRGNYFLVERNMIFFIRKLFKTGIEYIVKRSEQAKVIKAMK